MYEVRNVDPIIETKESEVLQKDEQQETVNAENNKRFERNIESRIIPNSG